MSDKPRMLPSVLYRPVGAALSAALSSDPTAMRLLGDLTGRKVSVEIRDLGFALGLVVVAKGRLDLGEPAENPDASVSGSLSSLMGAARSGTPRGLEVSGDAELVHGLARVMARVPGAAWERVAQIIGDVPARGLERFSRAFIATFGDARDRFAVVVGEYLQHEARVIVPRSELDGFFSEVDRLRADVDRLAKRIERLEYGRA